jgi:hypothetical protein
MQFMTYKEYLAKAEVELNASYVLFDKEFIKLGILEKKMSTYFT